VEGIVRVSDRVPGPDPAWSGAHPDPASSSAPYRIYNIGSNRPIKLLRYIELLEECIGRKAEKIMKPLQLGDVPDSFANVNELITDVGYKPDTPIEVGVRNFVDWYKDYYR
jgi:UDP-glucuronate 4-epimerase